MSQHLEHSQRASVSNSRSETTSTRDGIAYFWGELADMYGHPFTSQWGTEPDEDSEWMRVLMELKTLPADWKNLLRTHFTKWPPNPNQFHEMIMEYGCLYGLPSLIESWGLAYRLWLNFPPPTNYSEQHPMFYHMATNRWFDVYAFKQATETKIEKIFKRQFKEAYARCVEFAGSGETFDQWRDDRILEKTKAPPSTKEEARAGIAKLKEIMNDGE